MSDTEINVVITLQSMRAVIDGGLTIGVYSTKCGGGRRGGRHYKDFFRNIGRIRNFG